MYKLINSIIRLIRVRQYIKNTFVLAPLLFSSSFSNIEAVKNAFIAALLFCIASSSAYIINDIRDIDKDRRHPIKSVTRPLASGDLKVRQALALLLFFYAFLSYFFNLFPNVIYVIVIYLFLNVLYSYYLKNQPVLDIFSIASGFVLRVVAGSVAIGVPISSWMCITTMCLALYLAAVKRRQELSVQGTASRGVLEYYTLELINRYAEMSAIGALVFYSMYVTSAKPELVITIPLVLFGLFRYWFLVETVDAGESPTDAVLSDLPLIFTLITWILLCFWLLTATGG